MIVFAGPSLPLDLRDRWRGIDWRAPAEAGDFLALVDEAPAKVLLLDGYFEERAAVMHKEALSLMAAGTRLYGASSMGALRAAELHEFGMTGIGSIFDAYRSGLLVGDDEVALVHGDARIGWKAVSVPMVDVRATLVAAVRAGIIEPATARILRKRWHDIYYVDREWPPMIDAAEGIASRETLGAIAGMHVELKEADAIHAMDVALSDEAPAMPIDVPQTDFLEALRRRPTV
ncbi:TfuA domain-containing protein [Sphingomicrobium sediminis]|uniref:TfuA domain-containing protein n=1 Tax=Sphingomicrobium sediminis TaxID=2950949 RepID=A0A9X2EF15_9SPHN|nr:TfuA domain-containing protein [Sphingomicrobium sediminis]MCM8556728.1 TfuA domain-containing protein [Sphingomicrobium sediminis]